jgi:hypothetical protein
MSSNIPKQRGIFSEILTTEDSENLKVSGLSLAANFDYRAFSPERSHFKCKAKSAPSPR